LFGFSSSYNGLPDDQRGEGGRKRVQLAFCPSFVIAQTMLVSTMKFGDAGSHALAERGCADETVASSRECESTPPLKNNILRRQI
jgi:hypothetical protein